ncbi:ArsR/SmtB family transcription factor [Novosphingobium rosa]|uniref:ArsR/SmtB family transcription factor n=1 Tax=Novosphingobium rosa TaxID=76978 RepID=UPI0008325719|nr:helix-turn-helix transcriptional regulator [Novosphingobium rosa]
MPEPGAGHPSSGPDAVAMFAALGEPLRWAIMARLCDEGPLSTVMLGDGCSALSRQGLTKHLQVLEGAGLVDSMRLGRHRHWQVRADRLAMARACLDQVSRQWDLRLQRLQSHVENAQGQAG